LARRTDAVVRSRGGAPRQLVTAGGDGRRYAILTRPTGDGPHLIVAVRPRATPAQEELRLPADAQELTVTATWTGPVHVNDLAPDGRRSRVEREFEFPGVYVLEGQRGNEPWAPIYVGKADTETVSKRWRGRLRTFREFGLPLPDKFRVSAAKVLRQVLVKRGRSVLTNIDVVEAILTRQLLGGDAARARFGGAPHKLTNIVNASASSAVVVPKGVRVEIRHEGTPPNTISREPRILRTVVNATSDVRFELPAADDA
jgi:hypothetical protein